MTTQSTVIGRETQTDHLLKALMLGRNILIEGPVGVGKTFLIQTLLETLKRKYERVDGDSRYSEAKLTGWFDPPLVLKKGYVKDTFIDGPLVTAMREGKVLFINELNRMPEAVQNILLPAMDEKRITLPKLGQVIGKKGFVVIATQNPREFTATHALSEALLDRFEMIRLDYQTRAEEIAIVTGRFGKSAYTERAVDLVQATRKHPLIKRGASVRAALAIVELAEAKIDFTAACLMAMPSRIETLSAEEDADAIIKDLINAISPAESKKKDLRN